MSRTQPLWTVDAMAAAMARGAPRRAAGRRHRHFHRQPHHRPGEAFFAIKATPATAMTSCRPR